MPKHDDAGTDRSQVLIGAAILSSAVLTCARAEVQSYVRADCRPLLPAVRLDPSPPTAHWYRRFWTGECGQLRGCLNGLPNWNDAVAKLVARSGPQDRATVLAKACRLGAVIGEEWTRPREVRRIDTGDLRQFNKTLENSGNVLQGVEQVELKAKGKIYGR